MDNTEDLVRSLQTVRTTFNSLGIRYYVGGSAKAQELLVADLLDRLRAQYGLADG